MSKNCNGYIVTVDIKRNGRWKRSQLPFIFRTKKEAIAAKDQSKAINSDNLKNPRIKRSCK